MFSHDLEVNVTHIWYKITALSLISFYFFMTNIYSIRRHIHMNNKMNSIIFVLFSNVYEFWINWPLYQISTICSWKNQFGKWSEIFKGLEFYWCDNELVSQSVIHHRYGRYILNVISSSFVVTSSFRWPLKLVKMDVCHLFLITSIASQPWN